MHSAGARAAALLSRRTPHPTVLLRPFHATAVAATIANAPASGPLTGAAGAEAGSRALPRFIVGAGAALGAAAAYIGLDRGSATECSAPAIGCAEGNTPKKAMPGHGPLGGNVVNLPQVGPARIDFAAAAPPAAARRVPPPREHQHLCSEWRLEVPGLLFFFLRFLPRSPPISVSPRPFRPYRSSTASMKSHPWSVR